jgi:hypothetical protein
MTYYRCTLWKFRAPLAALALGAMKQVGDPAVLDLDLEGGGNAAIRDAIRTMMTQDIWGTGDEDVGDYRLNAENTATGEVLTGLAATSQPPEPPEPLEYFSDDELIAELRRRRRVRQERGQE